mgnify:CR=1 FL=1
MKMEMEIQKKLLTINPYSRPGTKRNRTTKIAVHYVGNANSKAINNRNYFENLKNQGKNGTYASSHYIVGLDGEVIQCVPDDEVAYTTNSANTYSIGIECCHGSDGTFNSKTRSSLVELVAMLLKKYNLTSDDIIRHYDVTGKLCPICWASNSGVKYQDYLKFKNEVRDKMEEDDEMVKNEVLTIKGKEKEYETIIKNGKTFVEMREFAQDLGHNVKYDPVTKKKCIS